MGCAVSITGKEGQQLDELPPHVQPLQVDVHCGASFDGSQASVADELFQKYDVPPASWAAHNLREDSAHIGDEGPNFSSKYLLATTEMLGA